MAREEFTGFNPSMARQNINDFIISSKKINLKIGDVYCNFIDTMRKFWASPIAKKFSRIYARKFEDLTFEFGVQTRAIAKGAVRAYNYAASANSCELIGDMDEIGAVGFDCGDLLESIDGKIGMNISAIRDIILPEFEKEVKRICEEIDNISTSIALYDDENGQQHAYSTNIDQIKKRMVSLFDEIIVSIKAAIEKETDNILLAKNQATDSLNG